MGRAHGPAQGAGLWAGLWARIGQGRDAASNADEKSSLDITPEKVFTTQFMQVLLVLFEIGLLSSARNGAIRCH